MILLRFLHSYCSVLLGILPLTNEFNVPAVNAPHKGNQQGSLMEQGSKWDG